MLAKSARFRLFVVVVAAVAFDVSELICVLFTEWL